MQRGEYLYFMHYIRFKTQFSHLTLRPKLHAWVEILTLNAAFDRQTPTKGGVVSIAPVYIVDHAIVCIPDQIIEWEDGAVDASLIKS